jgi:hypothetical protein
LGKESSDDSATNLDTENAKTELQLNDNFLVFYAVLVFTFITGMLTIIGSFKTQAHDEQTVLGIIYEGMLLGMVFSTRQIWLVLRANNRIVKGANLISKLKNYYEIIGFTGWFKWVLRKEFEAMVLLVGVIAFELLLFFEIGLKLF